jgi:hypothetical protein
LDYHRLRLRSQGEIIVYWDIIAANQPARDAESAGEFSWKLGFADGSIAGLDFEEVRW